LPATWFDFSRFESALTAGSRVIRVVEIDERERKRSTVGH